MASTVENFIKNRSEKFTAEDIDDQLRSWAARWLNSWKGNFEFLVKAQKNFRTGTLSDRQWASVLNCARADLNRGKPAEASDAVPGGYYTATVEGEGVVTLLFEKMPENASFAPGETVISSLDAESRSRPVSFGFLKKGGAMLWKKWRDYPMANIWADAVDLVIADPKGCAIDYARLTGRCGICNRELTDPESIARGIGPVCASKF